MAPLPSSHGLDLEEFLASAREAVGLVTRAAVEGDWEELEGLVEPGCVRVGGGATCRNSLLFSWVV